MLNHPFNHIEFYNIKGRYQVKRHIGIYLGESLSDKHKTILLREIQQIYISKGRSSILGRD